jgi:erythromycin esterase
MKHRLVRFLAQEMGFNMFAMETVWTEARQINDYVLFGKGDITQTLASHLMAIWNTREVLDLIEWMHRVTRNTSCRWRRVCGIQAILVLAIALWPKT